MVSPPWISFLVDVLMGAWAGAAAWFLTRRLGNRVVAGAIVATLVVISGAVGHTLIAPRARHWWLWRDIHTAGMTLFANDHTAAAYADAVVPTMEEPIFQEKLQALAKTPPSPGGPDGGDTFKAVGAKLVSAGMARLSGADVIAIFGVRRALAGMGTELCDAFWTGKITQPVLVDGLKRLKERDQMIWASVTARALALEVHAVDPPPHQRGADAEGAMRALMTALPIDKRAVLQKAFDTPDLSAEGGSQALKVLDDGSRDPQ